MHGSDGHRHCGHTFLCCWSRIGDALHCVNARVGGVDVVCRISVTAGHRLHAVHPHISGAICHVDATICLIFLILGRHVDAVVRCVVIVIGWHVNATVCYTVLVAGWYINATLCYIVLVASC